MYDLVHILFLNTLGIRCQKILTILLGHSIRLDDANWTKFQLINNRRIASDTVLYFSPIYDILQ